MSSTLDNQFLSKRPDAISLMAVIVHVAFVFCPVYLAAIFGWNFALPFLWLWYGASMNGLVNLMHECAHGHTFKRRSWCDFLGRWILAPLTFSDFDNYRQLHWEHHRSLGEQGDPKYTYKMDIRGRRFPILLLKCLLGIEAVKKFAYQINNRNKMKESRSQSWIIRIIVTQFIFITSLFAVSGWFNSHDTKALCGAVLAYVIVYAYGTLSLTLLMATLRAIAEHQDGMDKPTLVGTAALRNLRCGPIGRLLLGCYGFAEHATHHSLPFIPSYHLVLATKVFSTEDRYLIPRLTYLSLLRQQVIRPESQKIEHAI